MLCLHVSSCTMVSKSPAKSLKSLRALAEKGDAKAQYELGGMYVKGEGVAKDIVEAVTLWRKSAVQGHAASQFNLGAMYAGGKEVKQDHLTAYAWFNIAAANGDEPAKKLRDEYAIRFTRDQISRAQELSRQMIEMNPSMIK